MNRPMAKGGWRVRRLAAIAIGLAIAVLAAFPGRADYDAGVAAMRRNDATTALRHLEPLAREGNAAAQYQLGVLFAEGRGVAADRIIALKWFTCAAESASVNLANSAKSWRLRLSTGLDVDTLRSIEGLARHECRMGSALETARADASDWRHSGIAPRHTVLGAVFFFPGDILVTGVYQFAVAMWADSITEAINFLLHALGDWFVGGISVCVWCFVLRVAFVIAMALIAIDIVRRQQRGDPTAALRPALPLPRVTLRSLLWRDKNGL